MIDRTTFPEQLKSPRTLRLGGGALLLMALGIGAIATRYSQASPELGVAPSSERARSEEAAASPGLDDAAIVSPEEPTGAAGPGSGSADAGPADPTAGGSPQAALADADPVMDWVSPFEPSPVEPVAASERVPRPAAVRGIYIGAWSAGKPGRLAELIQLADETEINAFVIDIKDVTGEVTHATRVPLARQVRADRRLKIPDLRGVLTRLREHGIYPIARIVAFKDPLLAEARPEWAIRDEDGSVWVDQHGVRWVDSFNPEVWAYNIELAREALALGFAEVQWDYVRFPDAPVAYMERALYPERNDRTMSDGIREFLIRSRDELSQPGIEISADVFGITTSTQRDIGIGQVWEKMSDVVDVLLPMVYPSHYPRGSFGYPKPNAAPYQIVRRAMDDGVARSRRIEDAALIRPWLQAFTMGDPEYGPLHIRAQIDAVYDAGLREWVLWHPAVRYPREAFADANGVEPWFAGTGDRLWPEPDVRVERADTVPLGTPVSTGAR